MVPVDGDTRPAPVLRRIVISTADWRRASHPAISQTRMFERRLHALVAGMVLLGTAIVVTVVVALDRTWSALQALDDRWLAWMTEIRTPLLTRIARILSVVGGPLVMVPLRLTVIGALAWRRRWLQVGAFVGATVTSELCIGPLKALIDRPRPPGPLITTDSPSFPSGHAIAASVTALGLVVVLVPAANRRTRWTILAAVFAAVMAMSRTYLGAHWLTDVIAGTCIGTGLAVVWSAALELARARRLGAAPQVPVRDPKRAAPWLLVTSVVLLTIGLGCVVALHLLRPELAPVRHRLSEYAIGPYGNVMTAAFVSIGTGMVALGSAIAQVGTRWSRPVGAAIAAAAIGMVAAGIWRTDADRSGVTTDAIHSRSSGAATLVLIAAALTWSVARRRHGAAHGSDLGAGLAAIAAVLGAFSPALHHSAWTGISQRLLWLALLAWLLVTAWQLTPWAHRAMSDASGRNITTSA
jgi:membrane-associated phospholipid phosphatase